MADKRTDVWAFGCVLYEMLAGRRAFDGEDLTDTIAAVVRGDPDWIALPPDVPEQIRLLIRRCLEKDRRARIGDISTARFLMTETIAAAPTVVGTSSQPAPVTIPRRRVWVTASAALLTGITLATVAAWAVVRLTPARAPEPVRFTIVPPSAQPLALTGIERDIAFSPDGTHIVYRVSVGGQVQLMVRALIDLDARRLPGIVNTRTPFFSPNGLWVGFFDDQLRKVSITGGPAIPLSRNTGTPRGASWVPTTPSSSLRTTPPLDS